MGGHSYRLLQVALVVAGIPPLGFGLAAMIDAKYVQRIIRTFSGAVARPTAELNYLLKPLGVYLVAFGVMLLVAMADPARYRSLIVLGSVVLFARGVQRLMLTKELNRLFQIPVAVNIRHCIYLFSIAATLFFLRPVE